MSVVVNVMLSLMSVMSPPPEELRKLAGVQLIITVIRIGGLRWYRHVKKESDEVWVKKCMEIRVEGRRRGGRRRRTWLESVEADMVELDIDREVVNDRNK